MTVETKLRSAMAEAVGSAVPDTDQLVRTARRRGMGIRRRRQALGAVGVAAALAVATGAPMLVAGDRATNASVADSVSVGSVAQTFDPGQTSPITGRSTAAALLYAVGLEATGTATDFRGQGTGEAVDGGLVMTYGVFRYTPSGSAAAGEVGVNVQYLPPKTQAEPGKWPRMTCDDPYLEQCRVTTLADGSVLRTSLQRSTHGDRTGLMWTADLHRADHLRVVAYASNGSDITERDEKPTRRDTVLTVDQLSSIVTQAWWGPRVPTYFAEQGDKLHPFVGVGGAVDANASPSPKP